MKKVFLIHGFEGTPNGGWRPYLMSELAKLDVYACALPMPNPYTPSRDAWTNEITRAVGEPSEDIFLVGHSLGVPAILQYLQSLPSEAMIGGAVLVSGPFHNVADEHHKKLSSFFEPEFDFSTIRSHCQKFAVIHGDNDQIVPISDAEAFAKELGSRVVSVPNGGHLNGSSGWRELPQALAVLKYFLNL